MSFEYCEVLPSTMYVRLQVSNDTKDSDHVRGPDAFNEQCEFVIQLCQVSTTSSKVVGP